MPSGRVAILLTAASGLLRSQAPSFEVASLKPSGPNSVRGWEGGPGSSDPEQYRWGAATLKDLIVTAWNVNYFQTASSAPLEKDTFDLVAKVPPGATKEQLRAMLRNLLGERFHLKAHVESREFPAWELVVAKSGPKLKESGNGPAPPKPEGDGWPDLSPDRPGISAMNSSVGGSLVSRLRSQQEPLSVLAHLLRPDNQPVVDKTGLSGLYDFALEYSLAEASGDPAGLPSLFTALQQQLGLQLIHTRLPFDVVVVDSFDRLPTEN